MSENFLPTFQNDGQVKALLVQHITFNNKIRQKTLLMVICCTSRA